MEDYITVEEFFQYYTERNDYYGLVNLILYNIPLRDRIREVGIPMFVKEMKAVCPNNDKFMGYMDMFGEQYQDFQIGNLDIQIYSNEDDFTILGHTFHGIKELQEMVEIYANSEYSNNPIERSKMISTMSTHVGLIYEPYPRFDDDDFCFENRFYQNFLIRRRPIFELDIRTAMSVDKQCNAQIIHENMPLWLLPMVYYDGDNYILVATQR